MVAVEPKRDAVESLPASPGRITVPTAVSFDLDPRIVFSAHRVDPTRSATPTDPRVKPEHDGVVAAEHDGVVAVEHDRCIRGPA